MALLEIACFSKESAILAYEAGADRIELCDNRDAGGTTPPSDWLDVLRGRVDIPIYVMIRSRGGNFTYSGAEFDEMKDSIRELKSRAAGFVFGILDPQRNIDISRTTELVKLASPLPCTFHKAFDETPDLLAALGDVIDTGCSSILSSGGASNALAGLGTLRQLVHMSERRITIIPGGSLRANNVAIIRSYTRASMFHSSGIPKGAKQPHPDEIEKMKTLLNEHETAALPPIDPPSPPMSRSSDDEGSISDMLNSAVSIGPDPKSRQGSGS
ncbi:hypothetical protein LTR86_008291 [Recurvomyces mirabilis]|nr:hypothetical protein LTR86_008291 [Recurvomyces mirabilis]